MTEAIADGQGQVAEPLDTPQEFTEATSYQVRDELQEFLERDLLGPWDGENEVLPPRSQGPGERYLVGRLGPRQSAAREGRRRRDGGRRHRGGGDGCRPGAARPAHDAERRAHVGIVHGTVLRGRRRNGHPHRHRDLGAVRQVRGPATTRETRTGSGAGSRSGGIIPVRLNRTLQGYRTYPLASAGRVPGGGGPRARRRQARGRDRPGERAGRAARQQGHRVAVPAEAGRHGGRRDRALAVFCPIDDPLEDYCRAGDDAEDRQLRLLYRNQLRHAVGRNVAVHASVRDGERCAYRLETTWLPTYEVPATIAPPAGDGTLLAGLELSMAELASTPEADLAESSGPSPRLREVARRAGRQGPGLPAALRRPPRPRSSLRASARGGSRRRRPCVADPTPRATSRR